MTEIAYTRPFLYAKQESAFFTPKRYSFIEASTKAGKTVAAIVWIIEQALKGDFGQNFWWVAPINDQARIAFARIKAGLTAGTFTPRETPAMRIDLINGTSIWFKSADNPDCFDDQTEILTSKGWKLFCELDKTEDVLTLNPTTLYAEWKKPSRYIDSAYSGEMYRISSGKLDLLVTPNHRFLVKTRKTETPRGRPVVSVLKHKLSRKRERQRLARISQLQSYKDNFSSYEFKRACDLNLNDKIPAKVSWVGSDLDLATNDVCALLGIYLSEGCSAGSKGGVTALQNGDYTVHFTQSEGLKGGVKGNVRQQMRDLFQRLNLKSVKETEDGFFIRSRSLWQEFSRLGNCYDKFIPDRIKELPPEKLRTLLHWLILGDGTLRPASPNSETLQQIYYTTSKRLADDFQEIAIKAGLSAIIRVKNKAGLVSRWADGREVIATTDCYSVSIVNSEFNYLQDSTESYVNKENYDGRVYCVETENSTVLVRRNGKVCWSGNSLYGEDVYAAIVDEASRAKEESWNALRSTLTATQGPVRCIGNVKGRKNWFYRLSRLAESRARPNMHYEKITVLDAIKAGVIPPDELEDARATLPEQVFRELYFAEASDDGGNPFGLTHIEACVSQELSTKPPVAFGVDLAKKQDFCVVIGLDEDGQVCYFDRWQHLPWPVTIRRIWRAIGEDTPALVDSTGVGDAVLDDLREDHGNFDGYHFTAPSKQKLMEGLAVSIQSREIGYPDGPIRRELDTFEYVLTNTGVRYSAPEGLHDDCVCALALARQKWAAGAPAASLMQFYSSQASKAKLRVEQQDAIILDSDDIYRRRSLGQPSAEVLDNELTKIYNETMAKYQPEATHCVGCNQPLGFERITDGVLSWHPHCNGVQRAA